MLRIVLPRDYTAQTCSIARTLEILGDRWTLLIVRSAALGGTTRFADFQRKLAIPKDVLADRLGRLVDEGILERRLYQQRPARYEYLITGKGSELITLLVAMIEWGDRHYAPNGPPLEIIHNSCHSHVVQQLTCTHCHATIEPADVTARSGPGASPAQVAA